MTDVAAPAAERVAFTIDVVLAGTIHVTGMDLDEAVQKIRDIQGFNPDLPLDSHGGLVLHELSVGAAQGADLVLAHGDCKDEALPLDGMEEPHVCERCRTVYDEARGDGYMGKCPDCADATEPREEDLCASTMSSSGTSRASTPATPAAPCGRPA